MLAPRLPLGVREAHIFPSPDRPSGSRQVQKANKSPAKSPCIYQSGGLSSSRLDPHESRQQRAGRGAGEASPGRIWPRGRDTWRERAGAPRCSQLRGARRFTLPSLPHALPPALKSRGSGWGWGGEASSPGVFIFTSRPRCSYSGGNESYKGSPGRPPRNTRGGGRLDTALPCLDIHARPPGRVRLGRKHVETGVGTWVPVPLGRGPSRVSPFPALSLFQKAVFQLWNLMDLDSNLISAISTFGL